MGSSAQGPFVSSFNLESDEYHEVPWRNPPSLVGLGSTSGEGRYGCLFWCLKSKEHPDEALKKMKNIDFWDGSSYPQTKRRFLIQKPLLSEVGSTPAMGDMFDMRFLWDLYCMDSFGSVFTNFSGTGLEFWMEWADRSIRTTSTLQQMGELVHVSYSKWGNQLKHIKHLSVLKGETPFWTPNIPVPPSFPQKETSAR